MANWYGTARSNYFKVKDADAFKAWVDSLPDCVLIERNGLYGFYSQCPDSGGFPIQRYDDETEDYVDIELAEELAGHLMEGEVAVLMEAGAEKVRYISGWALAIASDGRTARVDLGDIYEKAQAEFGVMPSVAMY